MTMISLPLNKIQLTRLGLSGLGKISMLELHATERILVLAPHPNDESIAAGGMIASVLQVHPESRVRVIIATNGDASYANSFFHSSNNFTRQHFQSIAHGHQQECLSALTILGLDSSQISFWGFPEQGLSKLRQQYWSRKEAYRSPTTGFYSTEQAKNSPVLQYNGMNLLKLIQSELIAFRPTKIIIPHPQDMNSDHRTLALLTIFAVGVQQIQQDAPHMLAYLLWSGNTFWMPGSFFNENTKISLPRAAFRNGWKLFPLSKSAQEKKALALTSYSSQGFVTGWFSRVDAKNPQAQFEIFASIP